MYSGSKWPVPDITVFKLNCIVSGLAGFFFFTGWWIVIDAHLQYRSEFENVRMYHLPGVVATLSLVCVNLVPTELLYDDHYYNNDSCCSPLMARTLLFTFLMASFGCLIAGCFILINDFMLDMTKYQWPGYGVFTQNLFIFTSSMLLRFGKRVDVF